ncbi:MAG: hypothetical protein ABIT37_17535 [Luteolibacter sp.]
MKIQPLIRILALGLVGSANPVSAQHLMDQGPELTVRPPVQKAESVITDRTPLCLVKNSMTLESHLNNTTDTGSIIDLSVLREPSIYRAGPDSAPGISVEILRNSLALLTATYRETAKSSDDKTGWEIALSVRQSILIDPAAALDIVAKEIAANPPAACEIVKIAIQTTDADNRLVVDIVKAAINASPESMRIISQCAIAAAPESLSAIQMLLAGLDPAGGDSGTSAKSTKNPQGAAQMMISSPPAPATPNPLDLPPMYLMPPGPILPPLVSNVDP